MPRVSGHCHWSAALALDVAPKVPACCAPTEPTSSQTSPYRIHLTPTKQPTRAQAPSRQAKSDPGSRRSKVLMVDGDGNGLARCVKGICQAFNDGLKHVKAVKDKREDIYGRPPPPTLEQSLAKGADAVKEAVNFGVERFGPAYTSGDSEAVERLKDVQIFLQANIIRHLVYAQLDNAINDFEHLVNASNLARARAVGVLSDWYTRIAEKTNPTGDDDTETSKSVGLEAWQWQGQIAPSAAGGSTSFLQIKDASQPRNVTGLRKHSRSVSAVVVPTGSVLPEDSLVVQRPRKPSRTSEILPLRPRAESNGAYDKPLPPIPRSVPDLLIQKSNVSDTKPQINGLPISTPTPVYAHPLMIRTMTHPSASQSISFPTIASLRPSYGPVISTSKSVPAVTRLDEPSAANDYHGFCSGAFALQVDSKDALKIRKAMGPVQTSVRYWGCSNRKCAFEGEAYPLPSTNNSLSKSKDKDKDKDKSFAFDTIVRESYGVRFRWIFLAKSHYPQTKVKDRVFSYKCMFCALRGMESPVLQRISNLMEHLATHRGEDLGEELLKRTRCINDHIATPEEDFDVNLTPPARVSGSVASGSESRSSVPGFPIGDAGEENEDQNSSSSLSMSMSTGSEAARESVYAFFGPDDIR